MNEIKVCPQGMGVFLFQVQACSHGQVPMIWDSPLVETMTGGPIDNILGEQPAPGKPTICDLPHQLRMTILNHGRIGPGAA